VVQKIVKGVYSEQVEKVEIAISEADDLFREIRIENKLTGVDGQPVALTTGAQLDITFEAATNDIVPQKADNQA
jgi:DNA repair exonuclease SbcCD nuclease subunit